MLLFPFSISPILLCPSDRELRIWACLFVKMQPKKQQEKHSLRQVAQVHFFTFLFKLLKSCRLLDINFVHLCKWLSDCINVQWVFINLTKKGKNQFNEESAGLLPSNFCILLKAYWERERESNQKIINYIVHTFSGKINFSDIPEVCSFPTLWHEL